MGFLEGAKKMIKGWLDIQEAAPDSIRIEERFNFETNAIKNRIWMRGDPVELDQLYKQLSAGDGNFWGAVPLKGNELRKIHSGLPALMVKVLTDIVLHDLNEIEANDEWAQIEQDNDFKRVLRKAVSETLYLGDGAFKISIDTAVSDKPIIEFYPADRIDIVYRRGRYEETIFKTSYRHDRQRYLLKEHYGFGYIRYELFRTTGGAEDRVDLYAIPQTSALRSVGFGGYAEKDGVMTQRGSFSMAIPLSFYDSPKWEGRGMSIFDSKASAFDALDEVLSQWADAVRSGRAITYIPESMIPRDPNNGSILKPNGFDNRYIKRDDNLNETGRNEIDIKQPTIPSSNYLESYMTYLDLCLQGVISPSTLGIDMKKMDNAEAQREKEKATLYTRNCIIEALTSVLPMVVNAALKSKDASIPNATIRDDVDVNVTFGEYANPSFEAVVETVGKAKTQGIMSLQTCVDELYGDSKDDDWKAEEVKRLKAEQGIQEVDAALDGSDDDPLGLKGDEPDEPSNLLN